MKMQSDNLIEVFQREMAKFEEQQACSGMLDLDQEVPSTRTPDGDYLKAEIKTEEDSMSAQPQMVNLFFMEEALTTSIGEPNMTTSSSYTSSANTSWQIPFGSSTNTSSSFCISDSKDSLNTPTPYCSNAITGLKWEPSIISSSQSPFLSSASISSTAATVEATPSFFTTSYSTPVHKQSFLDQEVSLSSSTASMPSSDSRFDLTPPPSLGSSSTSSSSSSSPPPSFLLDLGFSPVTTPVPTTKTSTVTNGLAGSGCIVVSNNVNFLTEPPQQALNEDGLEYTDLDKQPFSLYDSLDELNIEDKALTKHNSQGHSHGQNSAGHMLDDPDLLQSLQMMHETLQRDCEELNMPFDPMLWTAEHVQSWISSLCGKYNVRDVSMQLYPIDGATLYSMPDSAFQQYGEAGNRISMEIACCKAAKSVMHQETLPQTYTPPMNGNGVACQQQTSMTSPCVSPAPSTCSNGFSVPSDHSDDEAVHSSADVMMKSKSYTKTPTKPRGGRNILLWQFLKELLLSEEPSYSDCIRWLDRQKGIFKIEDSKKVAYLWGQRKDHVKMNYDKLSRSIRQYYKKGIIKKTEQSRRLVYQFCKH